MNKTGYKLKFDFSCFILSQLIFSFLFPSRNSVVCRTGTSGVEKLPSFGHNARKLLYIST